MSVKAVGSVISNDRSLRRRKRVILFSAVHHPWVKQVSGLMNLWILVMFYNIGKY